MIINYVLKIFAFLSLFFPNISKKDGRGKDRIKVTVNLYNYDLIVYYPSEKYINKIIRWFLNYELNFKKKLSNYHL